MRRSRRHTKGACSRKIAPKDGASPGSSPHAAAGGDTARTFLTDSGNAQLWTKMKKKADLAASREGRHGPYVGLRAVGKAVIKGPPRQGRADAGRSREP
jgi:hypothetical protein